MRGHGAGLSDPSGLCGVTETFNERDCAPGGAGRAGRDARERAPDLSSHCGALCRLESPLIVTRRMRVPTAQLLREYDVRPLESTEWAVPEVDEEVGERLKRRALIAKHLHDLPAASPPSTSNE